MQEFESYLEERRRWVDETLAQLLPRADEWPERLHEAMRYSVLGGGKRLRPVLCLAAAEAVGAAPAVAMIPALAIECLHTYTLIHDDLPAMDNDDLRRGQPTLHKAFGEANAILAGDALLTFAFELLARETAPPPWPPGQLALELAVAAGSRGVAGGQYEDLTAEGREPDDALLERIHVHKTGVLIRASCRMGAIAAGAATEPLAGLTRYAEKIGLAFQIVDDILNVTSTAEQLGKAAGSDAVHGKMTYAALHGVEASTTHARMLVEEAIAALRPLGAGADRLVALARYTLARTS